ncbi:MFS transporter [Rhodococcus sp. CUA-806]|nr:MFS transporter [Rhodococcus sp. CUA-806]
MGSVVHTPAQPTLGLRRARGALFGVFGINGFLFAIWVVHIPTIERRTDITHATLGSLLLLLAAGAILGMQASGPLSDRFGSNRLVTISGALMACALLGPALSTSPAALGAALFVLGALNGSLDVSMNSQAVAVERFYGRPILSAFHALFSVGGVIGSLVGAATLTAEVPIVVSMGSAAVVGLLGIGVCRPFLLDPAADSGQGSGPVSDAGPLSSDARGRLSPRVLALGGLAFALLLSEGVANDWSTLQVAEHLQTGDGAAALAFGFFAAMMTVGRFCADRVSERFGPVAVVRYGNVIAAAGMSMVLFSNWLPLTLAGWAAFGLGLSGSIPQIFTSAGNLSAGASGTNMSRVVGMGYVGFLAGPAVIGWISHFASLTTAMAVPLVLTLAAAAGAGIVRPSRTQC